MKYLRKFKEGNYFEPDKNLDPIDQLIQGLNDEKVIFKLEYKSEKSCDLIINDISYCISIIDGPSHLSKEYYIIRGYDDNSMGQHDLEKCIKTLKYYFKNPDYDKVNHD